ncbi:MAG TPA: methyltransferase [Thermomicrobiales bacterium]|nr:methyltransferase [Thermomicrobiales bacterium]
MDNVLDQPACDELTDDRIGAGSTSNARRLHVLADYLSAEAELETQQIILPASGRKLAIRKPTEAARERMFEAARLDPDKQMPYWARIWPSGVALADIALERRAELAGQRVLELGCGLGTTASTLLEAGAILTVSDYSPLPLAFCRYNALSNTGRSPRTLRFNWRTPDDGAVARAASGGGYPLILAADVLYEGRDVEPLLAIVERILAPDGMLWLAEPGRKTAQRFLNTAAALGWHGDTQTVPGPWPDGSNDTISLHFLRRPTDIDQLTTNLGGWRT